MLETMFRFGNSYEDCSAGMWISVLLCLSIFNTEFGFVIVLSTLGAGRARFEFWARANFDRRSEAKVIDEETGSRFAFVSSRHA